MCLRKKSAQIREILISESAWEEMTCLFAPSLVPDKFMEKVKIYWPSLQNSALFQAPSACGIHPRHTNPSCR
jgi:hypothetical protein